jgi:DNA-binding transcriptional regulator GbsR (MarR family)
MSRKSNQANNIGVNLPNNMPVVVNTNNSGNLPPAVQQQMDERYNREQTYLDKEEKKTMKAWNNPNSKLRTIGEFLMANAMKEDLTYEKIAEATGINLGTCYLYVKQLNAWNGFPLSFQPTPKKAGHIQVVTKNEFDYELYNQRCERTIAKKEQVRSKAERTAWSKFGQKPHRVNKSQINKKKKEIILPD